MSQNAIRIGWQLSSAESAIQPLLIGDDQDALMLSQQLWMARCWVSAILPLTVPSGTVRLRITLSAFHRNEDIDRLLEVLYVLQTVNKKAVAEAFGRGHKAIIVMPCCNVMR